MVLLYFILRIISAVVAFLYPGYASYKTLSQRPASEAELERWLMYWSVLSCIVAVEYVAEWLISWVPFYYLLKTLFLLYLALPQTAGSSYLYKTHIQPFFASHESEIDSALSQLKTVVYNYLQKLIRSAWSHVASQVGQNGTVTDPLDEGGITRDAAANTGPPPSTGDPISGPVQLAQTLWRSYGPGILLSGATLLQQAQAAPAQENPNFSASLNSSGGATVRPYNVDESPSTPSVLTPPADTHSRNSSSSSLRERAGSGGKSTFEEVEVPSDLEGEGHTVSQGNAERRSSWFGWGNPGKGYERVKTE